MSDSDAWTIDSIAHTLPHPELRATFQREVSFTEVSKLPGILDKWVNFIERFEAERPRVESLRDYYREYGQLPAEYETESADGAALYEQWKGQQQQGAA